MSKFKCVLYSIIHPPPSLLLWYWNECDKKLFVMIIGIRTDNECEKFTQIYVLQIYMTGTHLV